MTGSESTPHPAREALARLLDGNARFVRNVRSVEALQTSIRREQLAARQSPFAIVLSCSDSRVPAEIVFDCGLGDLFVVRVAGNIAAPSLVGSVEFAASSFGTPLAIVMGHTGCGAVAATVDVLLSGAQPPSENLRDIVERIAPAIAEVIHPDMERSRLLSIAGRANVRATANHLRHGSRVLEKLVAQGSLAIVGAEYSLDTGVVDVFDGSPLTVA